MRLRAFALLFSIVFLTASVAGAAVDYKVRQGDTLSGIAKRYRLSIRDIEGENPGVGKGLKAGSRIRIPSRAAVKKSRRARGSASGDLDAPVRRPVAKSLPHDGYHTVKKGDTLSSLARRYSLSVGALKEMNNLKSSRLKRGQRLLVQKQEGPETYVVKKGDTVAKIAQRFGMDAEDLMDLNDLESPDIRVGQRLSLAENEDDARAERERKNAAKEIEEEITQVSESEGFSDKSLKDKLIIFAKTMLNIPYKFGGSSIMGIDCSAYVKKVYGLLGIDLPRTARQQFTRGEAIHRDELSIGDLVFFRTYASFPSHVGIYLGNNLFIHASSRVRKVTIDSLETPYYLKRFIGGKRLLTEEGRGVVAEVSFGG